jgi:hypothetical protein
MDLNLRTKPETTLAEGSSIAARIYDLLDVEYRSKALEYLGELFDEQETEKKEALGPYGNGD